ncbi:MAG: hypothetical protein V4735_02385 [Pseudomonadota bacterium]
MSEPSPTVPGRSCGDCALCCKILEIKALDKPRDVWCSHCSTRQKCDIYLDRPQTCRNYNCGYMTQPWIGEEWYPRNARMMISFGADGQHMFVQVDPTRADAWRREPYLSQLRQWARLNNPRGQQVIVSLNGRYIVVFPDREVDLGPIGDDETVTFTVTQTPTGPVTQAQKVKIAQS